MIDVSGTGLSGDQFAARLLEEERVAVMPGSSFGQSASGFLRISGSVGDAELDAACRRIDRFCRALEPGHPP